MLTVVTFKKVCAGSYTLTLNSEYYVTITYFSKAEGATFNGWIAEASWDACRYTDPLPTLKSAKFNAEYMLKTRNDF